MQPIEISPTDYHQLQDETSLLYMGDNTDDLTEAAIADLREDESEAWDSIR